MPFAHGIFIPAGLCCMFLRSEPSRTELECHRCRVTGKSATGQSHFVSVSPVQALSVCFMSLGRRVKSFTDTHSYSFLAGSGINKSRVL